MQKARGAFWYMSILSRIKIHKMQILKIFLVI